MKEYTVLSVLSAFLIIGFDNFSGIKVLKRKEYYIFLLFIFLFKLIVNGYLTGHIVMYNPKFFLGIRLVTIPLEDFLFGFSMVTFSIIIWERFKVKL